MATFYNPHEQTAQAIAAPQPHVDDHRGNKSCPTKQDASRQSGQRATGPSGRTASSLPLPQPSADADLGMDAAVGAVQPATGPGAGDPVPLLFTPAQAAAALQVRESWLRRRAASRQVPCTFLGKHLRFSRADLDQIVADAARRAAVPPSGGRRSAAPHAPRPRNRGNKRPYRPTA
ncbi:helix-turn-helix domain-containing protein [Kibdelosporangium persicum]|uniref:helix-turn-helix domain-containing protein n=1 Tax=Kibdelosporangium persicum TaxID=2698649 RepID=UPI0035E4064F